MTEQTYTVPIQDRSGPFFEGEYVVARGKVNIEGVEYTVGDRVQLDRRTATRMGSRAQVVPPESEEGQMLLSTTDSQRRELRAQALEAEATRLREEADED